MPVVNGFEIASQISGDLRGLEGDSHPTVECFLINGARWRGTQYIEGGGEKKREANTPHLRT